MSSMDTLTIILTLVFGIPTCIGAYYGHKAYYKKNRPDDPEDLAYYHQKEVVKKGLCPKCGSGDVSIEPIIDHDGDDYFNTGLEAANCNSCHNAWEIIPGNNE